MYGTVMRVSILLSSRYPVLPYDRYIATILDGTSYALAYAVGANDMISLGSLAWFPHLCEPKTRYYTVHTTAIVCIAQNGGTPLNG